MWQPANDAPQADRTAHVIREFGPIWVWREDLVEIISVMRQVAPDLTLEPTITPLTRSTTLTG
jgi:hypothetical protein